MDSSAHAAVGSLYRRTRCRFSSVVEQLICNHQVVGSNPTTGSPKSPENQRFTAKRRDKAKTGGPILVTPFSHAGSTKWGCGRVAQRADLFTPAKLRLQVYACQMRLPANRTWQASNTLSVVAPLRKRGGAGANVAVNLVGGSLASLQDAVAEIVLPGVPPTGRARPPATFWHRFGMSQFKAAH